jgi:hypothetical protein
METGYDSKTGPGLLRLRPVRTGEGEAEGSFHEEGDGKPRSQWTWARQREPPDRRQVSSCQDRKQNERSVFPEPVMTGVCPLALFSGTCHDTVFNPSPWRCCRAPRQTLP